MKVSFVQAASFRSHLRAWRRTLSADRATRWQLADAYLKALMTRLAAFGGEPPGRWVDSTTQPPRHYFELTGGTWVGYTVTVRRQFVTRAKVVELREIVPRPPHPAQPAPRRS